MTISHLKKYIYTLVFGLLFLFSHCGTSGLGGTEVGNSEAGFIDTSGIPEKFQVTSSALFPTINSSTQTSLNFLTYQSSSDWDVFLANDFVIDDILGTPNEGDDVVTKIRVILRNAKSSLTSLFNNDSNLNCQGAEPLDYSATIALPFLGDFSNDSQSNPRFDCYFVENDQHVIYGTDSNNVFYWALMDNGTMTNTEQVSERGNFSGAAQIIFLQYSETTSGSQNVVSLNLQHVQASIYSGVDDTFGTDDDVIFKSRTLIVGDSRINSSGEAELAKGDFLVTSFNQNKNNQNEVVSTTTQAIGRGGYGSGEISLFRIHSDNSTDLQAAQGYFCLSNNTDSNPSYSESTQCDALEDNFAWGGQTFLFEIDSRLVADFESIEFFNQSDLIANDRSDFVIPNF